MLMSSGATPGIGATTISSRSFSKTLTGTAVASVMVAPPAGPMLPRASAWLYSGRVAEPDKPAPGSEEWWRRVLTDPKEHFEPLRRFFIHLPTIAIRSGTVESLERVLA